MWEDLGTNAMKDLKSVVENFFTRAEEISNTAKELDQKTAEEVITYIADTAFIDGKSLSDMFPHIDEFLADMEEEADTLEERFNMNALLRTPVNLKAYHSTYDDRPWNPWEH